MEERVEDMKAVGEDVEEKVSRNKFKGGWMTDTDRIERLIPRGNPRKRKRPHSSQSQIFSWKRLRRAASHRELNILQS